MGFVPLLLIVLVIAAVAMTKSKGSKGPVDSGGFRSAFFIVLSAIGWIFVGIGISSLISAVPQSGSLFSNPGQETARALSFLVIGAPLALGTWKAVVSSIEKAPTTWTVCHFGVTNIALIAGLIGVSQGVVGLADGYFELDTWGYGLTWGLMWLGGRWVEQRHPTSGDLSPISWAAISLGVVVVEATVLLAQVFEAGKEALFNTTLAGDYLEGRIKNTALFLLVSGTVWVLSWWLDARKRPDSILRRLHTLVLGVSAGTVMAVSSLGTILFVLAEWWIGNPESTSFEAQTRSIPTALAAAIVGSVSVLHHRRVAAMPSPSDRAARATLAAIGAVSAAVGVGLVVSAIVYRIDGGIGNSPETSDLLLGGAVAILVGGLLWWTQWSVMQRRASADPSELAEPSRKRLILLMMAGSVLVAIPAVITLFYTMFNSLIGGSTDDMTPAVANSLGALAATGLLGGFYWAVHRADRTATPEAPIVPERTLYVVSGLAPSQVRSSGLAAKSVVALKRSDVAISDGLLDSLKETVDSLPSGGSVIIQESDGSWRAIPLEQN